MINVEEVKNKILAYLNEKGPALPVTLSSVVQLSLIFTSAILSEMLNIQKIKISHMKIGSSSLYFLPGQEMQLENFIDNLSGVEKTAYLKLKQEKILQDDLQEPAIRVALRSIKDFAIPFKFQENLYWKYFTIQTSEIQFLLKPQASLSQTQSSPMSLPSSISQEKSTIPQQLAQQSESKKPLLKIAKKSKPQKSNEFIEHIKSFLEKKDIELLKEISSDKRELIGKIRINSGFGKLIFLLIAKNKKKLQQSDITLAYQKAIEEKMPCYILAYEEPSKKTLEFLEFYKNIIKIDKIT